MKTLHLSISEAEYTQVLEKGKTEFIVPITEQTQDQFVKITPKEVTILLYDKLILQSEAKQLEVNVEFTELDYQPDEDGYIPLYENEQGKLCISDANIVYFLGEREQKEQ